MLSSCLRWNLALLLVRGARAATPAACAPGGDWYFGGGQRWDAVDHVYVTHDYFDSDEPRWYIKMWLSQVPLWADNPFIDRVVFEILGDSGTWAPLDDWANFNYARGASAAVGYSARADPGRLTDPRESITWRVTFFDDGDGCPAGGFGPVTQRHYDFFTAADISNQILNGAALPDPQVWPAFVPQNPVPDPSTCRSGSNPWSALADVGPAAWLQSLTAVKLCNCQWEIKWTYTDLPVLVNNPYLDIVSFRHWMPGGWINVAMGFHVPGTRSYSTVTRKLACDTDYLDIDFTTFFDEYDAIAGHVRSVPNGGNSCTAFPKNSAEFCLRDGVAITGAQLASGAAATPTACSGVGSKDFEALWTSGTDCAAASPSPDAAPFPAPTPSPTAPVPVAPTGGSDDDDGEAPNPSPVPVATSAPTPLPAASYGRYSLTITSSVRGLPYALTEVKTGGTAAFGTFEPMGVGGSAVALINGLGGGCYALTVGVAPKAADNKDVLWHALEPDVSGGALGGATFSLSGAPCGLGSCGDACAEETFAPASGSAVAAAVSDEGVCSEYSMLLASRCLNGCPDLDVHRAASACYDLSGCESMVEACKLPAGTEKSKVSKSQVSLLFSKAESASITTAGLATLASLVCSWLDVTKCQTLTVNGQETTAWMKENHRRRRLSLERLELDGSRTALRLRGDRDRALDNGTGGAGAGEGRELAAAAADDADGFLRVEVLASEPSSSFDRADIATTVSHHSDELEAVLHEDQVPGLNKANLISANVTFTDVTTLSFPGDAATPAPSPPPGTSKADDSGSGGPLSGGSVGLPLVLAIGGAALILLAMWVAFVVHRRAARRRNEVEAGNGGKGGDRDSGPRPKSQVNPMNSKAAGGFATAAAGGGGTATAGASGTAGAAGTANGGGAGGGHVAAAAGGGHVAAAAAAAAGRTSVKRTSRGGGGGGNGAAEHNHSQGNVSAVDVPVRRSAPLRPVSSQPGPPASQAAAAAAAVAAATALHAAAARSGVLAAAPPNRMDASALLALRGGKAPPHGAGAGVAAVPPPGKSVGFGSLTAGKNAGGARAGQENNGGVAAGSMPLPLKPGATFAWGAWPENRVLAAAAQQPRGGGSQGGSTVADAGDSRITYRQAVPSGYNSRYWSYASGGSRFTGSTNGTTQHKRVCSADFSSITAGSAWGSSASAGRSVGFTGAQASRGGGHGSGSGAGPAGEAASNSGSGSHPATVLANGLQTTRPYQRGRRGFWNDDDFSQGSVSTYAHHDGIGRRFSWHQSTAMAH